MRLSELTRHEPLPHQSDPDVAGITDDSRLVERGWLFVAVPGTRADGHSYVDDAIARGASAIVTERETAGGADGVARIRVSSSRGALADIAARFYGNPAGSLRLIGFTGTFGKTTTSEVLRGLLGAAGHRVGVLGSLGARYDGYTEPGSGLTTPAPVELHRSLRSFLDRGADTVIMEVTSHGMMLDRVAGLRFSDFVLAAIVPGEHTDFHRNYAHYVAAKARFIDYLAPGAVVAYDADNPAARQLAHRAPASVRAGVTLGRREFAGPHSVVISNVELDANGALITVRGERMRSSLLGSVNVRAVGLALAHALARDIDLRTARRVLAKLTPLPRRMQRLTLAGRTVLDDAAAHPDSFRATFEVADLLPHERLIVVYAVRGNRGVEINRNNALALADMALVNNAASVLVTASADVVGPTDTASAEEIDASRQAFAERACDIVWHDTLAAATKDATSRSSAGDLIVLVGAQGMEHGALLLRQNIGVE